MNHIRGSTRETCTPISTGLTEHIFCFLIDYGKYCAKQYLNYIMFSIYAVYIALFKKFLSCSDDILQEIAVTFYLFNCRTPITYPIQWR